MPIRLTPFETDRLRTGARGLFGTKLDRLSDRVRVPNTLYVQGSPRRGTREAVTWLRSARPDSIFLSVITLGEIAKGIAMRARHDPTAAAQLTAWLQVLRHDFADRILPVTDAVALEWGQVAALRPRGDADGLIAATAIVHDLILVTRNVADFAPAERWTLS